MKHASKGQGKHKKIGGSVSGALAKKLIPKSKYKIKAPYSMKPKGVCLHNTANNASAANEISYMRGNNRQVSYHVAVDDKEAIQAIPFNRNAWHAGDGGSGLGNRSYIGVEICYSKNGGKRFRAAEVRAAAVVAGLLAKFGGDLRTHRSFSGKDCPHRTSMKRFRALVKKARAGVLTTGSKSKSKKGKKKGKKASAKKGTRRADLKYVVKRGDTLGAIAHRYHTSVSRLARYNHISNPNFIRVGQVIRVPGKGKVKHHSKSKKKAKKSQGKKIKSFKARKYVVRRGDTLGAIAHRYRTSVSRLARYNHISNPNFIRVGQVIRIPGGGGKRHSKGKARSKKHSHATGKGSRAAKRAVQWALNRLGSHRYNNLCQAFVNDAVNYGLGRGTRRMPSAKAAEARWGKHRNRSGIPKGAAIYFKSFTKMGRRYGHVGLSDGRGNVIHAALGVRKQSLSSSRLNRWCRFSSWGWQGGIRL